VAKDKLREALAKKGPDALRLQATTSRQAISPVDIIAAAAAPTTEEVHEETAEEDRHVEEEKRTENTNGKQDEKEDTTKTNVKKEPKSSAKNTHKKNDYKKQTGKPRIHSERDIHALLAFDKRPTERYSFEIYIDQKEDIQRVCEQYEQSTGKKLSASRLIREVLDYFLPGALEAFAKEEE
jgi:hypothetical protein